jgi:hypothetical protein
MITDGSSARTATSKSGVLICWLSSAPLRCVKGMHIKCMLWFESCLLSHTPPRHSLVFSVFVLAEIVPRIPRVSAHANVSATTRDPKSPGAGRERAPCLFMPFSCCRMSSISSGFLARIRRQNRGSGPVPASRTAGLCSAATAGSTVFLCVVDPGVGGTRPAIILEADGRWYVGPGNGLFELVHRRAKRTRSWDIDWQPERLSASFHGRDLFAPVAGMLARGEPPPGRPHEDTRTAGQIGRTTLARSFTSIISAMP